jgi:hypothetical protein
MSSPVYERIWFTDNPDQLWEVLESGSGDWLGVYAGHAVIGEPPAPRQFGTPSFQTTAPGATKGAHGVRIRAPHGAPADSWLPDAEAARVDFEKTKTRLKSAPGPQIRMVELIENDVPIDASAILAMPDTDTDATPPPGTVMPR